MKRASSNASPDGSIAEAIQRMGEELRVVRQVLDEILDELQWANRNDRDHDRPVAPLRRITSMPLDPAATDWAERLNRFSAADLPAAEESKPAPRQPGRLF